MMLDKCVAGRKKRRERERRRRERRALYLLGRDIFITLVFISSPSVPQNRLKFQAYKISFLYIREALYAMESLRIPLCLPPFVSSKSLTLGTPAYKERHYQTSRRKAHFSWSLSSTINHFPSFMHNGCMHNVFFSKARVLKS